MLTETDVFVLSGNLTHMAALLTVNADVLHAIVSFLDAAAARSLSRTCRDVHLVAKQQALITMSVYLTNPTTVRGFCRYVLADASNLMHCIRMITLDYLHSAVGWRPDKGVELSSISPLLADVLKQASRLEYLTVHDAEEMFEAQPCMKDTVVAMASLDTLNLYGTGRGTIEMLPHVRSKPRSLAFCPPGRTPIPYPPSQSPFISRLSAFQNLRHLAVGGLLTHHIVAAKPVGNDVRDYDGPHWPSVRSLWINFSSLPLPVFLDAFPSLKKLVMVDVEIVDTQRKMPWQSLEHVILLHHDVTHFTYQAGRLTLVYPCFTPWATAILQDADPVSLSVCDSWYFPIDEVNVFPNIRVLEVDVYRRRDFHFGDGVSKDFTYRVPVLRPSKIFCIILRFDLGNPMLHEMSVAESLVDTIPSVRYIAISSGHGGGKVLYQWYRVHANAREGGGALTPEKLPDAVGARLHTYISTVDPEILHAIDDVPSSLFD